MSNKDTDKDQRKCLITSDVNQTVCNDNFLTRQVNNLSRGILRQEQERKSKIIKAKSIKTFPQNRNSSQIKTALNQSAINQIKATTIQTFGHNHNTFHRIQNGDRTYELQFRRKYLFKPQQFPKAHRDNIASLLQSEELSKGSLSPLRKDTYYSSIKPNNQSYAHVVALTEEAIHHRVITNF